MNRICKSLFTNTALLKHAFRSTFVLENSSFLSNQILSKNFSSFKLLSNQIQTENLNFSRSYVSNTDFNPSLNFSPNRDEFRNRDRSFSRQNANPRRNNNYQDRNISQEEDYKDAEPVEASGQQTDYSNKDHHNFSDFDIPEKLLNRLNQLGYKAPFEIQEKTLKHTLSGKDLIGKAFTGSGKTLAFAIPIISRIMKNENKSSRYPKCLVLSPTRELCLQLTKTIQDLAPEMKCISILGGTSFDYQINALNGKVDIVCATPGRLRDLTNRKNFVPDEIEVICLDEADELLTPNFLEQIKDVIELTNKKQMLMFSATINRNVYDVIKQYMKDPVAIDLTDGQKHKLPSNIEHYVARAPYKSDSSDIILHCLEKFKSQRCIIFTNMKKNAIKMNFILERRGIKSSDLHSDLSQKRREIILNKFRNGYLDVIVATDVAARGIDIPEVDLIIQVGPPSNGIDFYIHRSGRTGRAGRIGRSILIDDGSSNVFMQTISRLVKLKPLELPSSIEKKENSNDQDSEKNDYNDLFNTSRINNLGRDSYERKEQNRYNRERPFYSSDKFNNNKKYFDRFQNRGFKNDRYSDNKSKIERDE